MGKEQIDLEEKENPEIDEPADTGDISDSLLDGDDNFDDDSDDDDDDDDDDWDLTDSFHEQERGAELSQIAAFLNQTLMVRCERYNANLTSVSCRRKKESPPPRLKNATLSEEENMQNHPCFACVGPIIVNWNIDESPIALHEVEKQRVIVHPNLEDDFTAARAKQIELYKEQSKSQTKYPGLELVEAGEAGSPPPIVIETNDDERPRRGRKNMRIAAKAVVRDPRLKEEDSDDDDDNDDDIEFDPAKDAKIKLSKNLKIEDDDDDDLDDDLDLDLDLDDDDDSSTSFDDSDDDDDDDNENDDEPILASAKTESKSTKASSRGKKISTRSPDLDDDDDDDDDDEIEPPKAKKAAKSTKEAGESKASKAASKKTDKADPEKSPKAEAKTAKAPEKKAKSSKAEGAKAKVGKQEEEQTSENTEDQPPCASCGREYSPKHWRGDLCNPCYAKKLRERKKKEQSKGEVITPPKATEDQPPCTSCGREYSPKHWRGDICNPCYAKKLRERKKKQKPKK